MGDFTILGLGKGTEVSAIDFHQNAPGRLHRVLDSQMFPAKYNDVMKSVGDEISVLNYAHCRGCRSICKACRSKLIDVFIDVF